MPGAKGKSGGRRPGAGRPKGTTGTRPTPQTIERIRATINTRLAIETLHELCKEGGQHDSVRATAALGLLKFRIPQLQATDLTSGGEPITVQQVRFGANE